MRVEVRAPRSLLLKVSKMATATNTRIMTHPPTSLSQTPSRQWSGRVEAKHWLNHLVITHTIDCTRKWIGNAAYIV